MASMRDVARLAGVSPMTVSNVLNGRSTVNPAIRERVEAAIDATGYVRNEAARALRAGRSRVVGLLVLEAVNPFYGEFAAGAEHVLEAAGLHVTIASSHGRTEREASVLQMFAELRVRGAIITSTHYTKELRDQIGRLRAAGVAIVGLASPRDRLDLCTISGDDVLGGSLVASHLADQGIERPAYIGGPASSSVYRRRRRGYLAGLTQRGLKVRADFAVDCPADSIQDGIRAGHALLAGPTRPDAVFCANDLLALGVLQAATELDVAVPGALAVAGYDDIPFAAGAAIPLTSVGQDIRGMGATAARLLLAEAEGDQEHRHSHLVVTPSLTPRSSTRVRR